MRKTIVPHEKLVLLFFKGLGNSAACVALAGQNNTKCFYIVNRKIPHNSPSPGGRELVPREITLTSSSPFKGEEFFLTCHCGQPKLRAERGGSAAILRRLRSLFRVKRGISPRVCFVAPLLAMTKGSVPRNDFCVAISADDYTPVGRMVLPLEEQSNKMMSGK